MHTSIDMYKREKEGLVMHTSIDMYKRERDW